MNRHQKRINLRPAMAGVMLIEVLVSILIFSFGILGMVALYSRAVQYSTSAEDRNRAALLANDMASTMLLRRTVDTVALGNAYTDWQTRVGTPTGDGLPGGLGTVSAPASGTVTITITWTPTFSTTAQRYTTQVTL